MSRILICGFGSIGKKHALNAKDLGAELCIWCKRENREVDVSAAGFTFEKSLEAGINWCDGIVIATATSDHMGIAHKAAEAGKAIYLEKPVSHNREGVAELIAKAGGLTVEVGCQFRRHPCLLELKKRLETGDDGPVYAFQAWVGQRLDQWRPGTDYRQSYSAHKDRGGGALFDLVHEIDLMHWLAGPMKCVYADLRQISDLEMSAEDLASLVLVTKEGAAGTVQLDMLTPTYRRGMQIVCQKAVYLWDYKDGCLWRDSSEGRDCISKTPADFTGNDMLKDALRHFINRLDDPSIPPSCSLEEGAHDLDILLEARVSSEHGNKRSI